MKTEEKKTGDIQSGDFADLIVLLKKANSKANRVLTRIFRHFTFGR